MKAQNFEEVRSILCARDKPLAVWNNDSRSLTIATNYHQRLILHRLSPQCAIPSHRITELMMQSTHEQRMLLAALDRDIEQGNPSHTFFKRAPALYAYYKSFPRDIRKVLRNEYDLKSPSIGQKIKIAYADIPFLNGL
jgi:hypothetical protein